MTPRELTDDETGSVGKPFTLQELVLHGRRNWPAAAFFLAIAALQIYVALHAYAAAPPFDSNWEALISGLLGGSFLLVAITCALTRSSISVCPRDRQIHLHHGFGNFALDRDLPFSEVRSVRVTLWQSRRGPQSRLEILCHGEEIPCPPTTIPRQQALYLALVMNVRLIKVSDDPVDAPRATESSRFA